jgi:hypothetical protein
MDDFDARFDKAFSLVAFAVNRHLVDHMRRIGQALDTDLESVLIWGSLAHLNVAGLLHPGADPAATLGADGMTTGTLKPIRLADLAQVTGLPRETVRRKLMHLKERGKVEQTADGLWQAARSGVDSATHEFTRGSTRRLLQAAREIDAILKAVKL